MLLNVTPDLLELGLNACCVVARGLDASRTPPELLAYRRQAGQRLAAFWKNRSVSTHPAIAEYHRIHEQFGAAGQPPAPEKLITFVRRKRDFTAAGPVVDCYNIVSARTLLSIGAHDLAKFQAPITLRRCTAEDAYVPLGQGERQDVAGEYGYVDGRGRVICRLEVLQGDFSRVTAESRDVAFFLQGNRLLPPAVLLKGAWLLAEMIERFCGGTTELVSFHDAPAAGAPVGKPAITIDTFKGLTLRVGTVTSAAPEPTLPALTACTIQLEKPVEALALAPGLSPGMSVVTATGLHPLAIGTRRYTAWVLAAQPEGRAAPIEIASSFPDGTGLR